MSLAPEPEQHLKGYSPVTSEIFDDIEVELSSIMGDWHKVDGKWYNKNGTEWQRSHGSKGLIWTEE